MQVHPPTSPVSLLVQVPVRLVFAREHPCLHCGYDLRTREVTAICPECGGACADALESLHAARVEDVGRMAMGVRLMAFAAIGPPVLMMVMGALDIWRNVREPQLANIGAIGIGFVGPVLAAVGAAKLSTKAGREAGISLVRKGSLIEGGLAGWAAAAHAVCAGLLAVLMMLLVNNVVPELNDEVLGWIAGALGVGMGVAYAARNVLVSLRCAELARRSNAVLLRRAFVVLAWVSLAMAGIVVMYGAGGILAYVFQKELSNYGPGRSTSLVARVLAVLEVLSGLCGMGAVVWILLWPVMLSAMARHLGRVRKMMGRGEAVVTPWVEVVEGEGGA